jgi:hypothetical protein
MAAFVGKMTAFVGENGCWVWDFHAIRGFDGLSAPGIHADEWDNTPRLRGRLERPHDGQGPCSTPIVIP